MKSIITTALMLGLTVISCKKEVQTIPSADIDTIPAMDSTNMNLPPIPSDTITTVPPTTGDTMNTRNRDSAMTTPK
ncbi:hypothetical protein [Chryseobacterium sp. CFBP8996]|uniref:hypothetical protein n=1 Tax=Chryseobacterium sp. CFBP8996 TaxID=3096529 RepID=UPI002A69D1F4|nr:hypothetical protein [Chryseobacterium sp. CFBP8996]MDY0933326.1 hypothetical protein [Chryseobacterium sp. CFBP8996]